ncbi:MAG TPA: hypothetical protein VIV66_22205 [Pyrinomonadaceae bacterium]
MMFQQEQVQATIANGVRAVPSSNDEPTVPEALRNIVLLHQVCYEVWPEWSGCGGRARRIGYCVTLCGVNDRNDCVRGHHVPGCLHCGFTYDALRKIAEWITLTERQGCRFEIQAFDRAWDIAPKQRWSRNEITVNIKILHRKDVDAVLDDSQEGPLQEMRTILRRLGVREGIWQAGTVVSY